MRAWAGKMSWNAYQRRGHPSLGQGENLINSRSTKAGFGVNKSPACSISLHRFVILFAVPLGTSYLMKEHISSWPGMECLPRSSSVQGFPYHVRDYSSRPYTEPLAEPVSSLLSRQVEGKTGYLLRLAFAPPQRNFRLQLLSNYSSICLSCRISVDARNAAPREMPGKRPSIGVRIFPISMGSQYGKLGQSVFKVVSNPPISSCPLQSLSVSAL